VIVTSYLFPDGKFALDRLEGLENKVGREKLIVDISCRRREDGWVVAMNGWKTLTDMWVTKGMSFCFSVSQTTWVEDYVRGLREITGWIW